ncbi:MAG: hypothetical protein H6R33_59, partial [Actinobacteria bacterium]|nr:hypothetical protein [Actinomycetota bacterium]
RDGRVRVLAQDALTGEVSLRAPLPAGFDPTAITAGAGGSILVAGHRLGDGAVLLSQWAADGTLLLQVQRRPG